MLEHEVATPAPKIPWVPMLSPAARRAQRDRPLASPVMNRIFADIWRLVIKMHRTDADFHKNCGHSNAAVPNDLGIKPVHKKQWLLQYQRQKDASGAGGSADRYRGNSHSEELLSVGSMDSKCPIDAFIGEVSWGK